MPYTTNELIKAGGKAFFGLIIAITIISVFDSWTLGIVAAAALVFIPFPNEDTEKIINLVLLGLLLAFILFSGFGSGLGLDLGVNVTFFWTLLIFAVEIAISIEYKGWSKWLYTVPLVIAIGSLYALQPWNWTLSATIFIAVWVVMLLGGSSTILSGNPSSKAGIGMVFFVVVFFIFASGVGTQEVGSAFFGEWWPTVYQTGSQIFGPLGDAWSQLTGGLGTGLQLITNPMAFAQQIMNGTYGRDTTTGLAGAYGVEIERFTSTPVYIGQPYSLSMMVKNKGAFEAESVTANISLGEKPPKGITMDKLGFVSKDGEQQCNEKECTLNLVEGSEKMAKLDLRQVFFQSSGFSCPVVEEYDVKERFVPIKGYVQYDYEVESQLPIEFMSKSEWDRRVREGKLVTQSKKPSTITNAPVKLSIDTLEQPIREGNKFYAGILLGSAKKNGKIIPPVTVDAEIPEGFRFAGNGVKDSCSPNTGVKKDGTNIYTWTFTGEPYLVLCQFKAMENMGEPTRTFLVKANASYTFSETKDLVTKLEFGGVACCEKDGDCPTGETCENNECTTMKEGVWEDPRGKEGFCSDWKSTMYNSLNTNQKAIYKEKCQLGWGGCSSDSDCDADSLSRAGASIKSTGYCRKMGFTSAKICCPQAENPSDKDSVDANCETGYNSFMADQTLEDILKG